MAKMFLTFEEARLALCVTDDELKQFAREGRLREYRDGPRCMFKADQVFALASSTSPDVDPELVLQRCKPCRQEKQESPRQTFDSFTFIGILGIVVLLSFLGGLFGFLIWNSI